MDFNHRIVLLQETIDLLNIRPDGVYADCTLGGAGHAREIVKRLGSGGLLIGFDQDPAALEAAAAVLTPYGERVRLIRSNFRQLTARLQEIGISGLDGVIFDLGVSSPQIDRAERGFSYQQDAPLDMRMDPEQPLSAREVVNDWEEYRLATVIKEYGEERWAKRIAKIIIRQRTLQPIVTTGELVEIIKAAIPAAAREHGSHPAKRTFQALRIAVNDELHAFRVALTQAIDVLNPGGRVCVISFHSLEDRITKDMFRERAGRCTCPPKLPICGCGAIQELQIITRQPVTASAAETIANPRARSAKLRAAERI